MIVEISKLDRNRNIDKTNIYWLVQAIDSFSRIPVSTINSFELGNASNAFSSYALAAEDKNSDYSTQYLFDTNILAPQNRTELNKILAKNAKNRKKGTDDSDEEATKEGNKNSATLASMCRNIGLLEDYQGSIRLTSFAKCLLITDKVLVEEYVFALLAKQWVKVDGICKRPLLCVIYDLCLESNEFLDKLQNKNVAAKVIAKSIVGHDVEDKDLKGAKMDILKNHLLLSGLFTCAPNKEILLTPEGRVILKLFREKEELIPKYSNDNFHEYIGRIDNGAFAVIDRSNASTFSLLYPNLVRIFLDLKNQYLNTDNMECLQQIFYGAPGTGKSHEIKEKTEGQKVVRTTFHPDSDYSSFVGAYKPTMEEVDAQVVPVVVNSGISLDQNKGTYKEKRISYKFVIQAFLKAYLGAWKMYSDNPHSPDPQFLVIEEINRGNCAQIFGDLFQLLDRNEKGFSEYPIEADSDLTDAINTAFSNEKSDYKLEKVIDVEGVIKDYISNYGFTLSKDIQEGRVLLLPPNLFIWATMNTSDQSLFPIDSAFKRRWDWQYIKIAEGKQKDSSTPLGWKILVEDEEQDRVRLYDWWRFLQLINTKILSATDSADKQMGYFFAKATESFSGNKLGVIKKEGGFVEETSQSPISYDFITAETFVNKVLFYLWTDVLKDNEYEDIASLMKDGDKSLSFPDFFGETGKEISPEALRIFLDNVMKEEDVRCEVAEWTIETTQTNNGGDSGYNFLPNSVIFKITEDIQDPDLLYERARKTWRMAKWRAEKTEYFYVYATPLKKIKACYKVNDCEAVERDGKIRYQFEGVLVENTMVNQPVEAISHSRGQVVFYPDNWQNKEQSGS